MARYIQEIPTHAYLVEVMWHSIPLYYGPYTTLAAAKGQLSVRINYFSRSDLEHATGRILTSAVTNWEEV